MNIFKYKYIGQAHPVALYKAQNHSFTCINNIIGI